MQQLQTSFSIGAIIQERYRVEDILGKGGFSIVYLVRDLQCTDDQEQARSLFAFKVLSSQKEQERLRFAFEGEVLQRLSHSALPTIHQIFADRNDGYAFIVMDYVEGPSLEALRKQQPNRCFPLEHVLKIMEPIVDAVIYLHKQQPSIIHRDIKPANIIVPESGKSAVLVDFGIAKEYDPDATTTAIRHVSPGYGAPEQYSSLGTDPRTDIYGLAATCYTLLTGIVPADAFHRLTSLAGNHGDPLILVSERAPNVPESVAQAIQRALSITTDERFSTIEEFWQAVKTGLAQKQTSKLAVISSNSDQFPALFKQKGSNAWFPFVRKEARAAHREKLSIPITRTLSSGKLGQSDRKKRGFSITLACILLLLLVFGLSFGPSVVVHLFSSASTSATIAKKSPKIGTTVPSGSGLYLAVSSSYAGTIHNLLTQTTTSMSLTRIQQNNESFHGYFNGLNMMGTFKGVLDSSKHIFFTASVSSLHETLFFEGSVRPDRILVGNFCNLDATGQCVSDYGLWSVTPGP